MNDINKMLEKKSEIEVLLSTERNINKLVSEVKAFKEARNNANEKQNDLIDKFEKTLDLVGNKSNKKSLENFKASFKYQDKEGNVKNNFKKAFEAVSKFIENPKEIGIAPKTATKAISILKSQEVLKDIKDTRNVAFNENKSMQKASKDISIKLNSVKKITEKTGLTNEYFAYKNAKGADRYNTNIIKEYVKNLKDIKAFEKENTEAFKEASAKLKQPERASQEHSIVTRIKTQKFGDKSQVKNQVQSR
tara:strand:+ start:3889 stop:4635 length:747 start_codon:yes stop_codon:yes gene_type:complete